MLKPGLRQGLNACVGTTLTNSAATRTMLSSLFSVRFILTPPDFLIFYPFTMRVIFATTSLT